MARWSAGSTAVLGSAFFGESMFHRVRDCSKLALVHLVARLKAGGFTLLDTQFVTDHLRQFGAVEVPQESRRLLPQRSQEPRAFTPGRASTRRAPETILRVNWACAHPAGDPASAGDDFSMLELPHRISRAGIIGLARRRVGREEPLLRRCAVIHRRAQPVRAGKPQWRSANSARPVRGNRLRGLGRRLLGFWVRSAAALRQAPRSILMMSLPPLQSVSQTS